MFSLRLCVWASTVLAGCSDESGSPVGDRPNVTLQLNWKPEPQFGGFYAMKLEKYDASRNVDVDVEPGGVGTPTVQMVAAGKVPFGVVSADELVIARSNGADVVALFAVYQTNPQGLMAHASRGFKQIGDVFAQGGTVAMQRGLPYAAFLEKKFGFDKVRVVPSPGGDLSAFRSDPNYTMQCFVTSEPLAAKKAGLDVQTFLVADGGYNPYTTVLVTRGDYLQQNPDVVKNVVAAVKQGWESYLRDPNPANAEMGKLNESMDAETFTAAAEAQRPLIETAETKSAGIGSMTRERWQALCEQLKDLKVVENPPKAEECFVVMKL
jgi:NitT/TauT family transport system substrate-binding protein